MTAAFPACRKATFPNWPRDAKPMQAALAEESRLPERRYNNLG
jgi:hypothetical protein